MPGVSLWPFESHPFTIANADIIDNEMEGEGGEGEGHGKDLVFLVNARKGFTKRLWNMARRKESLMVFLDGPYGWTPRLEGYDTVVLIAGEFLGRCLRCRGRTEMDRRWRGSIVHEPFVRRSRTVRTYPSSSEAIAANSRHIVERAST